MGTIISDTKLQSMAKVFAVRYPNPNLTWEDHYQELQLGMLTHGDLKRAHQGMFDQYYRMCPGLRVKNKSRIPFIVYFSSGYDCEAEVSDQDVYELSPEKYQSLVREMYERIDTLPQEEKTMVLLRSFGYTNTELSKIFNTSTNTMKVKMWRIIKKLRREDVKNKQALQPDKPTPRES